MNRVDAATARCLKAAQELLKCEADLAHTLKVRPLDITPEALLNNCISAISQTVNNLKPEQIAALQHGKE